MKKGRTCQWVHGNTRPANVSSTVAAAGGSVGHHDGHRLSVAGVIGGYSGADGAVVVVELACKLTRCPGSRDIAGNLSKCRRNVAATARALQ